MPLLAIWVEVIGLLVWSTFQGIHPRIHHASPFLVELKSKNRSSGVDEWNIVSQSLKGIV